MNQEKFDIKQLCPVPPPYGGVSVHVKRLVDRLTTDGLLVGAYYTPECTDDRIIQSGMYDLQTWDSKTNVIIKTFRHIIRIFNRVKEIRPYKVVHSHSSLEDMFLLWIIRNCCGKKLIVTIHNSMQEEFYRTTNAINKFFMKRLAKQDVTWIAVSEQAKFEILKLPFSFRNEIQVIPAYIPPDIDSPDPLSDELQMYLTNHSRNIVFYAHSFMLHNGIDVYGFDAIFTLYANLLKEHKDLGLVFCLTESNDQRKIEELHRKAVDLNIDDKLFWQIGAIDKMQALWSQADVYVRPTNTDGDSLAVREALDMGVKVVASNVCYRPEGVVTYEYGNEIDLLEKVQDALALERGPICQNFTYYDKILNIYKSVLNSSIVR